MAVAQVQVHLLIPRSRPSFVESRPVQRKVVLGKQASTFDWSVGRAVESSSEGAPSVSTWQVRRGRPIRVQRTFHCFIQRV